jgi:hypothetical protein
MANVGTLWVSEKGSFPAILFHFIKIELNGSGKTCFSQAIKLGLSPKINFP